MVLTTVASQDDARRLARTLVDERLAACVTRTAVASTYRWQDGVEEDEEWLLVVKTVRGNWSALVTRIGELSSYEVPEVLALAAEDVAEPYRAWLVASSSKTVGPKA